MVLMMILNDGNSTEEKVYREVHKGDYSDYVAGFYANKNYYRWGMLVKMRGTQRETVHVFGDPTR